MMKLCWIFTVMQQEQFDCRRDRNSTGVVGMSAQPGVHYSRGFFLGKPECIWKYQCPEEILERLNGEKEYFIFDYIRASHSFFYIFQQ